MHQRVTATAGLLERTRAHGIAPRCRRTAAPPAAASPAAADDARCDSLVAVARSVARVSATPGSVRTHVLQQRRVPSSRAAQPQGILGSAGAPAHAATPPRAPHRACRPRASPCGALAALRCARGGARHAGRCLAQQASAAARPRRASARERECARAPRMHASPARRCCVLGCDDDTRGAGRRGGWGSAKVSATARQQAQKGRTWIYSMCRRAAAIPAAICRRKTARQHDAAARGVKIHSLQSQMTCVRQRMMRDEVGVFVAGNED
jgi:hypothetical protein